MDDLLTKDQGASLVQLARRSIGRKLGRRDEIPVLHDDALCRKSGTFVTLKIRGQLRGCIGNLEPADSIVDSIERNSLNAAFHDFRFSPLTPDELDRVSIDISILTPATLLAYSDGDDLLRKLRPGIDGVILSHGHAGATFLPQVWEQLPQPERFLGHLCRKAGLPERTWCDGHPEIRIYQVQCFEEENL
jgi:AmmeMemoRadiSam system protein A